MEIARLTRLTKDLYLATIRGVEYESRTSFMVSAKPQIFHKLLATNRLRE
jgi:hypothetical protein